jgi:tRNA threonylcarbamoyladenosine biosynthesis protein TsaE
MIFDINSIDDLERPARWILNNYPNGGVFFLRGTLASGKTTFVQAFAKLLGYNDASSPTFSLINDYDGKIYHYDIYQIKERNISLFEIAHNMLESGWHFVEWADDETAKIADILGIKPIWNDFCVIEGKRQIKIE